MLDINPALLLTVLVVFLSSIKILNSILYRPMMDFMEKRDNTIKHDLSSVQSNSQEVNALEMEAEKLIAEAKKEAGRIRDKSLVEAKEAASQKIAKRQKELETQYASFKNDLEQERAGLKNALRSQLPIYKENFKAKLSQL